MPNERKYIDAEKLNALLDDLCITDGIYDAIQSLPAADVTEVKHGNGLQQDYVLIVTNFFKVDIFHIIALTAAQ